MRTRISRSSLKFHGTSYRFSFGTVVAPPAANATLSPSAHASEEQQSMKPTQIHDPYHNPFHNRFHVPVHSRLDEMQAYTQMVWLKDQMSLPGKDQHARHWGR